MSDKDCENCGQNHHEMLCECCVRYQSFLTVFKAFEERMSKFSSINPLKVVTILQFISALKEIINFKVKKEEVSDFGKFLFAFRDTLINRNN